MSRRKAREYALQILYQFDLTDELPDRESLELFWQQHPADDSVKEFTESLVEGAIKNLDRIDGMLESVAKNWELKRMAVVDRNIMRFATYELLYRDDIPAAVTINEAIEIAKKYSTKEAASFINGVLDKIAKKINKRVH